MKIRIIPLKEGKPTKPNANLRIFACDEAEIICVSHTRINMYNNTDVFFFSFFIGRMPINIFECLTPTDWTNWMEWSSQCRNFRMMLNRKRQKKPHTKLPKDSCIWADHLWAFVINSVCTVASCMHNERRKTRTDHFNLTYGKILLCKTIRLP